MDFRENVNWEALADELRSLLEDNTIPQISCCVEAKENMIEITPGWYNVNGSFHHVERLADFCRYKRLLCWISAKKTEDGLITVAHIF